MRLAALPKICRIAKTSICQTYCTNCRLVTPHLVTRDPKAPETYSCGVCGDIKKYSVK